MRNKTRIAAKKSINYNQRTNVKPLVVVAGGLGLVSTATAAFKRRITAS